MALAPEDRTLHGYRLRRHQWQVLEQMRASMPDQPTRLAVAAVPGSGKTLTLALLAADLILSDRIGDEGEVLVVTVQNAAVANINQRIRAILEGAGFPPVGFRVCTLHKLAADILRERADLAGVSETLTIVDDGESRRAHRYAADAWINANRDWWESFVPDGSANQRERALETWRSKTEGVSKEVTKLCKHLRYAPERAGTLVGRDGGPFLRMGIDLYAQYQRYLQARGGLDFDDLIWRAMDALAQDAAFLAALRRRWPYILEDEAQDSSPLQQEILSLLAGDALAWVRVGDPNQAINSTFTAADPRYFRHYQREPGVTMIRLPESGRCARPIIDLANELVRWTAASHPLPEVRVMAFEPQQIEPTGPGDAQPNPPAEASHLVIRREPQESAEEEAEALARWAASYVRRWPERSAAILCPANWLGTMVVDVLKAMDDPRVEVDDLLRSTPKMRQVAQLLGHVCAYLADPTRSSALRRLYVALQGDEDAGITADVLRRRRTALNSLSPERALFPHTTGALRDELPPGLEVDPDDLADLESFAQQVARWVRAAGLPIDQLLLTIGQDLFDKDWELALCHTIAEGLRSAGELHPEWRLAEYAIELDGVAKNKISMGGLSLADGGYVARPGAVAVTTMHKAKGLEWDAVYLMSVDNLEFPTHLDDAFRDEPYFMPGRAPSVEARKELEHLARDEPILAVLDVATDDPIAASRLETIAERLRLLYVGITRARIDLCITWSRRGSGRPVEAAETLLALAEFAERTQGGER